MHDKEDDNEDEEKKSGCYLATAFGGIWIILLVKWLWPTAIPFTLFEFWTFRGSLTEVLTTSWPILAWAIGVSIVTALIDTKDSMLEEEAEKFMLTGTLISIWAGVVEEICFRWIIFYSEIAGYKFINILLFGLPSYIYFYFVGPTANFFTLGYLQPFLFSEYGWAVGAAIVSSNGKFRDGHSYQGTLGYLNSWFLGMCFFYLMFKHGLLAAMLIHFLYDFLIFFVHYLDAVNGRAKNKCP